MAKKDPLEEVVKYINATHSTHPFAQLFGTTDQALNTLQRMNLIGGGGGEAKEEPGWGDNVLAALQGGEVVLTDTAEGRNVPSKWYDVGEDGTVTSVTASMLDFPIRMLNAAFYTYKGASGRAAKKISGIKEKHPTDEISAIGSLITKYQTYHNLKQFIDPDHVDPVTGILEYFDKDGNLKGRIVQRKDPKNIPEWMREYFTSPQAAENGGMAGKPYGVPFDEFKKLLNNYFVAEDQISDLERERDRYITQISAIKSATKIKGG